MKDKNKGKRYHLFTPLKLKVPFCPAPKGFDNFISARPVKVFGVFVGIWWTLAKKGYVWGDGKVQ